MPGPSVFPSGEPGVSGDFWVPTILFSALSTPRGHISNDIYVCSRFPHLSLPTSHPWPHSLPSRTSCGVPFLSSASVSTSVSPTQASWVSSQLQPLTPGPPLHITTPSGHALALTAQQQHLVSFLTDSQAHRKSTTLVPTSQALDCEIRKHVFI